MNQAPDWRLAASGPLLDVAPAHPPSPPPAADAEHGPATPTPLPAPPTSPVMRAPTPPEPPPIHLAAPTHTASPHPPRATARALWGAALLAGAAVWGWRAWQAPSPPPPVAPAAPPAATWAAPALAGLPHDPPPLAASAPDAAPMPEPESTPVTAPVAPPPRLRIQREADAPLAADVGAALADWRLGAQLAEAGLWSAAWAAYQRAYQAYPHPALAHNLALTLEALGQPEAARHWRQAAPAEQTPERVARADEAEP